MIRLNLIEGLGVALASGLCVLAILLNHATADYYDGLRAYDASDYPAALAEWEDAANAGDAQSQYRLGKLYEEGLGVPQNFVEAHRWYNLAAAQGDADARAARDAIAGKMTAEELAQARKLAADWRPVAAAEPSAEAQEPSDESVVVGVEGDASGLIAAVRDGDGGTIDRLLASGADPNAKDADGNAALIYALMAGQSEAAARLIDAGADANTVASNGWSALMVAAQGGRADLMRLLLDRGASAAYVAGDGLNAAQLAQASGSAEAAALLPTSETAVPTQAAEGPASPEQLLIAAGSGDLGAVNRLLSAGVDPNAKDADGWTSLIFASIEGHLEVVTRLLEAKSDPNVMGSDGATALMAATLKGHTEIAKALIAAGADVKQINPDGLDALIIAEQSGNKEIAALFNASGARKSYPKELVREVQQLLTQQGIDVGGNDGLFGPSTERGIKEFQTSAKIPVDGQISEGLLASLRALPAVAPAASMNLSDVRSLENAIKNKDIVGVSKLIDSNRDLVNAKLSGGLMPIHLAVYLNDATMVYLLLDLGAYVNGKSNDGKTPLTILKESNFMNPKSTQIYHFLITKGATLY